MTKGSKALAPCRYCGGKHPRLVEYSPIAGKSRHWVECVNQACHVNPRTVECDTEQEAIEEWNAGHEQTCTVLSAEYDGALDILRADLSCGHTACIRRGQFKLFKFCPECGAKVMFE